MDRDGTKKGYDLDLTKKVSNLVNIPVIASGGVGSSRTLTPRDKNWKGKRCIGSINFSFWRVFNTRCKKIFRLKRNSCKNLKNV